MNFDSFRVPPAPADLRDRVLASTRTHRPTPAEQDWVDRIWENRWLRFSWATTVICIVVCYFLWRPPQERTEVVRRDLPNRLVQKEKTNAAARLNLIKTILEEGNNS